MGRLIRIPDFRADCDHNMGRGLDVLILGSIAKALHSKPDVVRWEGNDLVIDEGAMTAEDWCVVSAYISSCAVRAISSRLDESQLEIFVRERCSMARVMVKGKGKQ